MDAPQVTGLPNSSRCCDPPAKDFTPQMHGIGRTFSRFRRDDPANVGHVRPHDKLAELRHLLRFFVCGPSLDHERVDLARLASR